MRAVDTNVLVRLIVGDDPAQVAAAERFIAAGAWVSTLVLADASWQLRRFYELSAKELGDAIEMLLSHRKLEVQYPEIVAAALELFRARPALGFFDCLILASARTSEHLPLGTFDRKLASVEGAQQL